MDSSSNPLCNKIANGAIYTTVTNGQAPYSYDWDHDGVGDNDDTQDLLIASGGTATLIVTDQVGCTRSQSATLTEPDTISLSFVALDDTIGRPGSIDLSATGGTSTYIFDWDNDLTGDFDDTEDISNLPEGDYTVDVMDANGCIVSTTVSIVNLSPAFISSWKTDNSGTSSSSSITIPTNPALTYSYDVDWDNDGVYDEHGVSGDITHDFGTAGIYDIRIRGTFPSIYFNNGGDAEKLLDVSQWGNIEWGNFFSSFRGCSNLNFSAVDTPDLTRVSSFKDAFNSCTTFNSNIDNWTVSNVSNFYGTFQNCEDFNQPLNNWDMTSASTLEYMFGSCSDFNQDLNNWNVSNVSRFTRLFQNASSFNQDLNSWNTSNANNFQLVFEGASSFNGIISNWNLSNATTIEGIFLKATDFNQDVSGWNVANVTDFSYAFSQANDFNQDLSNWNVAKGTDFSNMLNHAFDFDQDLSSWDVSLGSNFEKMFRSVSNTDYNYYLWNISNMTNGSGMFNSTTLSTPLYDSLLIHWNGQILQSNVTFGGGNSVYCLGADARANMAVSDLWIITDGGGETTPPTALCQDRDAYLGNDGYFKLEETYLDAGSSDNCGDITFSVSQKNFYCADIGIQLITVIINDNVGNTSTCTANLTVKDTSTASITCPRDTSIVADVSNCRAIFDWDLPSTTCSIDSYSSNFQPLDTFDLGISTVIYTALDFANLSHTCTFDVTITNPISLSIIKENSCFENNTGTLDLTITGASTPYQVDWSADSIGEYDDPEDLVELLPATYYLGVIDNINCEAFETVIVDSYDTLSLSYTKVDQDVSNSNLGSIDLTIIGTATPILFDWNTDGTGDFDDTEDLVNLTGGTYGIVVKDSNNCQLESFIYIDNGSNPFVTVWNTSNEGVSDSTSITIPTRGGLTYNYDVDWDGDGIYDEFGLTGDATHDYGTPGIYTVRIKGDFPAIQNNDNRSSFDSDRLKLIDVSNWGGIAWENFGFAFKGCSNMEISAIDTPDLSGVTNMQSAFAGCDIMNTDLNHWDVGTVTNFKSTFQGCDLFNQPLDDWDMSQGIDLENMLRHCTVFNQDLNSWDLGNATDVNHMFQRATNFNGNISSWNVENVTNFNDLFRDAVAFNQDLSNWNVGSGTSFRLMFDDCVDFTSDISNWDMSNATNLGAMFRRASSFNADLNGWDVSDVTNFGWTFASAISFNSELSNWNVSSAEDMEYMFIWARQFDDDLGDWDVSNVVDAKNMFDGVTLSTPNYDSLLIGWNRLTLRPDVTFSGGNSIYCLGADARANMIASDGWIITDAGGETEDPVALCKDTTLYLNLGGELNLSGDMLDAGSTDNCGALTYSYSTSQFTCGDEGSHIVTMTIADNVGNLASCDATLEVSDTTQAIITCPSDTLLFGSLPDCRGIADWNDPKVSCPIVSYSSDIQKLDTVSFGITTVTYTALDQVNTSYTCQFNIEMASPVNLSIDSIQNINCTDALFEGAAYTTTSGGIPSYLYNWDNSRFDTIQDNTQLTSGTHRLVVQDSNSCEASTNFTITIDSLVTPTLSINPIDRACLGDVVDVELELTNARNFTAAWYVNSTIQADNLTDTLHTLQNLLDNDTIKLIVSLDDECSTETTLEVETIVSMIAPPQIAFNFTETSICSGETILLEPYLASFDSIIWYDAQNNIVGNDTILSVDSDGEYTAKVFREPCPVVWSTPINATEIAIPQIDLEASYSFFENENGASVSAYISPATSTFEWLLNNIVIETESLDLILTPITTSTYTLVADNEGCNSQKSTTINRLLTLKIPEMFTPNGDGVNDQWIIEGSENYPQLYVSLYDRWGGQVLEESAGSYSSWEGKRNGKDSPDGIYFFVIRASNDSETIKGTLTIAR